MVQITYYRKVKKKNKQKKHFSILTVTKTKYDLYMIIYTKYNEKIHKTTIQIKKYHCLNFVGIPIKVCIYRIFITENNFFCS